MQLSPAVAQLLPCDCGQTPVGGEGGGKEGEGGGKEGGREGKEGGKEEGGRKGDRENGGRQELYMVQKLPNVHTQLTSSSWLCGLHFLKNGLNLRGRKLLNWTTYT